MSISTHALPSVLFAIAPIAAQAQETVPTNTAVPSLMFFTIGAVLFVAIAVMVSFLRKKSNRDATTKVLNPNDQSNKY